MARALRIPLVSLLISSTIFTLSGAVTVSISPDNVTLRVGGSRQFRASVSGATNRGVDWSATGGSIGADGTYTAPAVVPASGQVTIKATSQADKSVSATTVVTIQNLQPTISSVTPSSINTGLNTTVTIKGANFLNTLRVLLDGKAVPAVFVSATEARFSLNSTAPAGTSVQLTVQNPDPGAATSSARTLTIVPPVSVRISPEKKTLRGGATVDFGVSVSNNANRNGIWYVNDSQGGNDQVGRIDANGLYTAPLVIPAAAAVTVKVAAEADPRATASAAVTLLNPLPVISTVSPDSVKQGTATVFTVDGSGFAKNAVVKIGSSEKTTTWISPSRLQVSGQLPPQAGGLAAVVVANPDPGAANSNAVAVKVTAKTEKVSYAAAAKFLDQAAWGPTPESIAYVQEIGIPAWIEEQFNLPVSTYPDPVDTGEGLSRLQRVFFANALTGKDQLRQRVAFALGQILVVSGTEASRYHQMVPYQRILLDYAFRNYKDLLYEVTLNPTMGIYLDMVNNDLPDPKRNIVPNENYAREVLQLFSLGLTVLNADGSATATPAYTEADIKQLALVFTGWTFPPQPGFASKWKNPSYFYGRMVPFDEHHDRTQKQVLGSILPPGRTAQEDLDAAMKLISSHPNVAPFVSYRLIQHLVTGNPAPAYVARVSKAFTDNQGDMKAVIRAIFSGNDAAGASDGHLREPVLFAANVLRALNVQATAEASLAGRTAEMGQNLFNSPSVFNYFSPFYRVNGAPAPEFQILNPSTALARINFVYAAVRNGISSTVRVDLSNLEALAGDPPVLVDAVSNALLRGQMTPESRTAILTAVNAATDARTRVRNALYLAATSNLYQVER